jgi:uncharacterized protein (TIGR02466 family)
MNLEIHFNDLFPTRIWQADVSQLAPHFPAWIAQINAMRAAAPVAAGRSNRGGWNSTDKTILHQPSFAALREVVDVTCKSAFEQMGIANQAFTLESWVNMHDRGGFNFEHMHDGALISGAFYLQVPKGAGSLVLRDPRPRSAGAFLKAGAANAINDLHIEPQAGLLVVFPYWLEHHVEPHESDVPRIAISFNALKLDASR